MSACDFHLAVPFCHFLRLAHAFEEVDNLINLLIDPPLPTDHLANMILHVVIMVYRDVILKHVDRIFWKFISTVQEK